MGTGLMDSQTFLEKINEVLIGLKKQVKILSAIRGKIILGKELEDIKW